MFTLTAICSYATGVVLYFIIFLKRVGDRIPGENIKKGPDVMVVLFLSACSMGCSTSSLYSALAKTVSRPALPHPCDSTYNPGNDLDLDQDPADPLELLRECREVLRNRPAQLQRAFVQTGHGDARQTIRVMQWNVLAQGINLHLHKEMTLNGI